MNRFTSIICVLIIFLTSIVTISFSQILFTKDPNNPVMSGRGSGTWNMHVGMPCVLFNPDSVRYEMWYVGMLGSPNWRPYSIGYAFSDDGITWTKLDSAVLTATPGSWDESTVEWPRVIRENGQYKMWYTGWSPTVDGIGYATSPDGINWTKHPTPVLSGVAAWASGGFGYCTVLPVPTGYKMWFTGWNESFTGSNIGYASSSDGISWQRDTTNNPVLRNGDTGRWDDQFVALPGVNYIDNTYYMWFNGNYPDAHARHRQVGLASSTDGIHWNKYNNSTTNGMALYANSDPVLVPSPNQWDGTYVENGSVLLISDTLHMWYCGSLYPDATNKWHIGHATFPADTFFHLVGIEDYDNTNIPKKYFLSQNYPNPFNPKTTIEFSIPKSEFVTLKIYNLLGQEVALLVSDKLKTGNYKYTWDAGSLSSGVYFYELKAGNYVKSQKMILLK